MGDILLIEGNRGHADTIALHLKKHHFQVTIASSVREARQILTTERMEILVIDLNISDTGFLEFYRWIKDTPSIAYIPRLFITGKQYPEIEQTLVTEHNENVLQKPLNIKEFVNSIRRLVNSTDPGTQTQTQYRIFDYLASLPGRRVGSSIVEQEIARGGMGAVFLGRQEALNRKVAIKVLLPSMMQEPSALERFQREARAIAQLKNPHIVQVFDFGQLEYNFFYIIMEYLPGETVEKYLERSGPFPIDKAVSVITQVARGLITAHDAGLIHRDIKPSNLIMDNSGHVTITDFGLVRPQKKVQQTQTGMIIGTPQYLPPEQASGMPMDHRSDIYSLGMVFYHLLVGQPPFTSNNPMTLLMKHINEPLPDPIAARPDIPQRVAGIIQRMAAKDPVKRYMSCRELIWDLESIQGSVGNGTEQLPSPIPGRITTPPPSQQQLQLVNGLNRGFQELQERFPSVFSMDKLKGVMTLSESGALLDCQGVFPEEWKNTLFILQESTREINTAVQLGEWQFIVMETAEEIVAQFPIGSQRGTMRFDQTDTKSFNGSSLSGQSSMFRKIEEHGDPVAQIAAVASVVDVLLFNRSGRLGTHRLKSNKMLEIYNQRFSPVVQVIQSVSFDITSVDIWFEKGRVLLWKLEKALLLVIADRNVSRSFLSIFISSHLESLNNAALQGTANVTDTLPVQPVKTVTQPVPSKLMSKIQLELARAIGPIAKVIITKEIKTMGYHVDQFPHDELAALVNRLGEKAGPERKDKFIEAALDILYEAGK